MDGDFNKIHFHGKFRDYQQRVLDNVDKYLQDGKINIVAAPGSGKTVLGLELICRIGAPCIVLSPTTAIRQQWGERFRELFLEDKEDFSKLFSNDLHSVKLLNSVTYQALYSAIEKISTEDDEDIDCSDVDIFATMKQFGIKIICLDEAHHLRNEWQKALEKFISLLDKDVKIISLTATPPYDSEASEWNRYKNICGEIDEEIFVPELVGQNTLCPHQDYIYFNYPTEAEVASFLEHKQRAAKAVEELGKLLLFSKLSLLLNGEKDYDKLFTSVKEYIALITLLKFYNFETDKKLINRLTAKRGLPNFNMRYAETAIQFLLNGELISDEEKLEIIAILKKNTVFEKRKVTLQLTESLRRTLISSVGKLESIKMIAKSEIEAMGEKLRMLILTDYIKRENLEKIASEEQFNSVSVVSIFETLRRNASTVKIGVLSGTLVILPKCINLSNVKHKKEDILGTDYCVVEFTGSTNRSVDYVGKLFEDGEIQILVGTKSLLGEGWDSPCINSLILASFVGKFVLSNQMRGRAIRVDKNNLDKTANIWHLATVEPDYLLLEKATERIYAYLKQDKKQFISYDYEVLERRFDCFMGPNYTTGEIESGIERITAIKPPFDKNGIERINSQMLSLAAKRSDLKAKWQGQVMNGKFAVEVETSISEEKRVPIFTFWNFGLLAILSMVTAACFYPLIQGFTSGNIAVSLVTLFIMLPLVYFLSKKLEILLQHINPANSFKTLGKAVYQTLCECELIYSTAKAKTHANKGLFYVSMYLSNASIHDQNIFNTAMTELLSPIENPRYILIAKNNFKGYDYNLSFACPSVIGKKKEFVEVLAKKLMKTTALFEPVYTRNENGRELILKCRKLSYITFNQKKMNKKYKVSHWD